MDMHIAHGDIMLQFYITGPCEVNPLVNGEFPEISFDNNRKNY